MDFNILFRDHSSKEKKYLEFRKWVGIIGMALPFVLVIGKNLIAPGDYCIEDSVSDYYHTNMGDVFVGILFAVSVFFLFYAGYAPIDNYLSTLTGMAGMGVAIFPTCSQCATGTAHLVCAGTFLLSLAVFSLFLFTKTKENETPTPRKILRNRIYITCGVIMIMSLIAIVISIHFYPSWQERYNIIYWGEVVSLIAFGCSWLVKGETILKDRPA